MSNFTPLNPKKIISSPKKNFNFLLWGNLILVVLIAIVGLIYYNSTLQTTKQKAAGIKCSTIDNRKDCESSCSPQKANGKSYACKWLSTQGECQESGNECGGQGGVNEEIVPGFCNSNQLAPTWVQCNSGNGDPNCIFCLKSSTKTCIDVLLSRGCPISAGGNLTPGSGTSCNNVKESVTIYYCKGVNYVSSGKGCQGNDPLPEGVYWDASTHSIKGKFCGTIQIDDSAGNFCSKYDSSGCNDKLPISIPTNTPTKTPTLPPTSIPTSTPTSVNTPTPTTPSGQPTNTPVLTVTYTPTQSPTPTEIIIAKITDTPIINSPTSTPAQQLIQSADKRSSWIFALPIGIILLGLML